MLAAQAAIDPGAALAKGWLLGNGRGDFASGTAAGARARATQALLAIAGPGGRPVPLLLSIDGQAIVEGRSFDLAASRPGEAGHALPCAVLEDFGADPWPHWRFRAGSAVLERHLFLVHGHPALILSFRQLTGPAITLTLAPALHPAAFSPASAADAAGEGEPGPSLQTIPGRVRWALAADRSLTLWHGGAFVPTHAHAAAGIERGEAAVSAEESAAAKPAEGQMPGAVSGAAAGRERGVVTGFVEATLGPDQTLHVIASAEEHLLRALAQENRLGSPPPRTLAACTAALEADERARQASADRAALLEAEETARQAHAARHPDEASVAGAMFLDVNDRWTRRLARALDLGWIEREGRTSLVRSLPGGEEGATAALRTVRGLVTLRQFERARDVLCAWGQLVREGLVPSSLGPSDGRPRYREPEPSLWLVIATELYARRAREHEFVRRAFYPALEEIIERFRTGTRLGLRVDGDSLLVSGEARDAAKRADLNALWYHAQAAMGQLARALGRGEHAAFYLAWAREHQTRFNEAMWDEEHGCLYQALSDDGPVRGLEPAQILAAMQPPALLTPERALRLVQAVERELFTPFGLRTSPGAPRLAAEWLGPFVAAYLRVHRRNAAAQAQARAWLAALERQLERATAGHVPSAFELQEGEPLEHATVPADEDPLSVLASAELLRTWVEEFDHGPAPARPEEIPASRDAMP